MTLDDAMHEWNVLPVEDDELNVNISDWWAVQSTEGIVAYFADEVTACRFRLAEINRRLNG